MVRERQCIGGHRVADHRHIVVDQLGLQPMAGWPDMDGRIGNRIEDICCCLYVRIATAGHHQQIAGGRFTRCSANRRINKPVTGSPNAVGNVHRSDIRPGRHLNDQAAGSKGLQNTVIGKQDVVDNVTVWQNGDNDISAFCGIGRNREGGNRFVLKREKGILVGVTNH